MASPCLKGVVALIVSHSNSVVNDKAALTLRLTGMGATVASRFSGLVTHIIFRRKPHATEDNRFEEDQALFDLYARIDKVRLPATFISHASELTWPSGHAGQTCMVTYRVHSVCIFVGYHSKAWPPKSLHCGATMD